MRAGLVYKKYRAALDQYEVLRLQRYGPPTVPLKAALLQIFASGPFFWVDLGDHDHLLPGHESHISCEYYDEFFSDSTRSHEWHIDNNIYYDVAREHLGRAGEVSFEARPSVLSFDVVCSS